MKIVAINGSPRKDGNNAKLLEVVRREVEAAEKPIKETGVEEVEIKLFQDVSARVKVSIEGQ